MKAIPFHSSVRIKLDSGKRIEDKMGHPIGIKVIAKTIKNKVAAPFRRAEFEIHFGKGIVEHEYVFDIVRKYCATNGPVAFDDKIAVDITGTGAWKSIQLINQKSGALVEEKKFYKSEFDAIIKSPQWNPYVMTVFNATFAEIMGNSTENADVDTEAYEEIRQIAIDLEGDTDAFTDL